MREASHYKPEWSGERGLDVLRTEIDGVEVFLCDEGTGRVSCDVMVKGSGYMIEFGRMEETRRAPRSTSDFDEKDVGSQTIQRIRRWAEANGFERKAA